VGCNVVDSDFDIRDYAVQFEDCMDDEVVNFELLGSSKNNDYRIEVVELEESSKC
jgi:hypothetical protein